MEDKKKCNIKNLIIFKTLICCQRMSANKIRNDAWWLLKCYDYLLGPLQMSDPIRLGWQDFRVTLESKMEEHARAMEELENNTKSNHISLEIKEILSSRLPHLSLL
jgi:hypothetical protein